MHLHVYEETSISAIERLLRGRNQEHEDLTVISDQTYMNNHFG